MPQGLEKEHSRTSQGLDRSIKKDSSDVTDILSVLDATSIRTTPFGANVSGENSYRRAERISAALHIITNHIPEDEPLRASLRTKGLMLLALILDMRSGFRGTVSDKGQTVLAAIRELISLVRLLAIAGFVSVQNAQTLADALDELGSLIVVSQRSSIAEQLTISHDQLIPPPSTQPFRQERAGSVARPLIKKTTSSEATRPIVTRVTETTPRSGRIVEILKMGGVLGIKDIASNLPQYSEKMIQRELADLVESGEVLKVGEKRWSKYQYVR